MAFKLASLFVEITGQAGPLMGTLGAVKGALGGLLGQAKAVGSGLVSGLGIAAGVGGLAAIGAGMAKAITAGSDLNETLNKIDVIFGAGAKKVIADSDAMAAKFGTVKSTYLDASAEIGNLLIGMGGMSEQAAGEMTKNLTHAAADAGSIFNKGFGESVAKIASAIRGESQPISEFGVNLQEAAVKSEAMRLGLVKTNRELTTQEKVAARTSLIIRGLKVAEGDLANTSGGFANSSRALWGRLENALAGVGQAVMPVIERALGGLNKFASGVGAWVENNKATIAGWAEGVTSGVSYVGEVLGEIGAAIAGLGARIADALGGQEEITRRLGDAWQWLRGVVTGAVETIGAAWRNWSLIGEYVGVEVRQLALNIGEAFEWGMKAAGTFTDWLGGHWREVLADALNAGWTVFKNWVTNLKNLWSALMGFLATGEFDFTFTPLLDGFKSAISELPDIAAPVFSDLSDELAAIFDKMLGNEQKRLDDKARAAAAIAKGQAPGVPRPARERTEEKTPGKDKGAEILGAEEFAKRIQEAALGKGDAAQKTAEATAQTATNTARVVTAVTDLARKIAAPGQKLAVAGP